MLALTHTPSPRLTAGERTFVPRLEINLAEAAKQHAGYCQALRSCGCEVRVLEANLDHPDGTFLEDTAIVLPDVAIVCSMGTAARRGEAENVAAVLAEYRALERIDLPATIEGGDVLRLGRRLLVGQSPRTSAAGSEALSRIAGRYGYDVWPVPVRTCLHLKTACTALPDGRLVVNPRWIDATALRGYDLLKIPADEPWGANVLPIGERVLLPAANVRTAELVRSAGFAVHDVEIGEFAKAEGGVTCLSILIE